jgi:hypothetical protein
MRGLLPESAARAAHISTACAGLQAAVLQRISPPGQDLRPLAAERLVLRLESLQLSADALRDPRVRHMVVYHMCLDELTTARWVSAGGMPGRIRPPRRARTSRAAAAPPASVLGAGSSSRCPDAAARPGCHHRREQTTEPPILRRPGVLPLDYAVAYSVLGRQGDVGRARERLLTELAGPEPCLLYVMAVSVEQPQVDWDSGGWPAAAGQCD